MRNKIFIEASNFHVDKENGVVVCTITCNMQLYKHPAYNSMDGTLLSKIPCVGGFGRFHVKAKARCNSVDTFNEKTGKRIAESRAKIKMFAISNRVYRLCADSLRKLAVECDNSAKACTEAMLTEDNHVLELIK